MSSRDPRDIAVANAPASTLPLATRELAEILLERLDAATGQWEVELIATDGRLHTVRRHEKLGVFALERFDRQEGSSEPLSRTSRTGSRLPDQA